MNTKGMIFKKQMLLIPTTLEFKLHRSLKKAADLKKKMLQFVVVKIMIEKWEGNRFTCQGDLFEDVAFKLKLER